MDKFKITLIILTVCLIISILFNVYLLFHLSNSGHKLEKLKSVSIENIGLYDLRWKQFPQQNSNMYYVDANFRILNFGEMEAFVVVALEVMYEGNALYEFFKTDEGSSVGEPIIRYGYFIVPPGAKNCSLTFSYWNPENLDTYLFIRVVEAFPA